jgi:3-deoxy-D-manno-octulosonic-acid transferase
MGLLLDFVYLVACILLAPWFLYRLLTVTDWRELGVRFGAGLGQPLEASVWLHGASAGEVSLLKPLVALLERDLPDTPLVISSITVTGLSAARKLYPQHRVVAFPFDLTFVVRRCLKHFDPRLVIVVESEFWPNFITCARRQRIPVAIVNGKMSARSFNLHARIRLIPRVLATLNVLAVQTEEHAGRFRALGVAPERVHVTGNMKYDLAQPPSDLDQGRELRRALGYAADDIVIIGGSLHLPEDEALLDAYGAAAAVTERASLMIVPRFPADAPAVEQHARQRGYATALKSAVDAGRQAAPGRRGILIVDTVGELGRLYAAADIAFVGGSLFFRGVNKGGHNLMEPAILAVPVLFGPYNFSFKETAEDLLAANAGGLVRDRAELVALLETLVADGSRRRELGARAQQVVRARQGATARNHDLIIGLLGTPSQRLQALDFDRKIQ